MITIIILYFYDTICVWEFWAHHNMVLHRLKIELDVTTFHEWVWLWYSFGIMQKRVGKEKDFV